MRKVFWFLFPWDKYTMIKKFLITYMLPIIFFMMLTLSISYKVLPNTWAIAHNDWAYYFNIDSKKDYQKSVYTDDYLGTDLSSIVFLHFIKANIASWLKSLWTDDNYVSYIITFWLAFICSLLYYFIFFNISWNRLFWYFAGIFVIFNNFTIESLAFGGYFYYFLWLISFSFLFYLIYRSYNDKWITLNISMLLVLASIFIVLPIHLLIYIIVTIVYIIFLYFSKRLKYKHYVILIIVWIILLHSYWIFPFITKMFSSSSELIYGWNANNVFSWYTKIASYLNIISFRQYFNIISWELYPYIFTYIWYIWILWSMIYILLKKESFLKKEYAFLVFLFILYFIFFNISLWPNSTITWAIWVYLWDNFSIFHFLRSFTRFLIILIPVVLLFFTIYLKKNDIHKWISLVIFIWLIITHPPLLSWNLNGVITSINIPNEYKAINKLTWNSDRTISYPNISYETYNWSVGDSKIMKQDYYLQENYIKTPILYNRASLSLQNKNITFHTFFNNNLSWLANQLKNNNIQYVLVHKDSANVFNGKKIYFQNYIDYFSKHSNQVLDNGYFSLYKLNNVQPKIFSKNSNLSFKQISSVKYKINIKNLNINNLYFLNNFSDKWKIYAWKNGIENKYSYYDISFLFKKDYFSSTHKKYNEFANSWILNKEEILNRFPKGSYSKNSDWTINVDLVLYYIPQVYYYIWKILSWITLIFLITSYLFIYFRRKYEK